MQIKFMVLAIGAILGGQAVAQNQPTQAPASPAQQVVIPQQSNIPGVAGAPPQSANPYGSIQQTGSPSLDYNGVNNLEGRQIVIPPNVSASAANGGIPNPAQAQQQMGAPTQLPTGLPQDNFNPSQTDGVQATINILNTPDSRIREINRDLYRKGQMLNESPIIPPKPVNGMLTVSMSPGSTPPVIRLAKNRTSAIILTDITGQPWPIVNVDGLSTEDFTVKRLDAPPDGYVLSVTPKGAFVNGNLIVILKGLPSPLSIEFTSAQKEVDARTEIRVQASGPNTQYSSIGLPSGIDSSLLSLLQGVPPEGAKPLTTSSNAVQAWLARDGKMYVRTRYKVMSPAFENVSSSPDGTYAYKMMAVPVVLYKAAGDRFGEFNISGF